jgi:putative Mg2+ transporter-C (MgtC) family protein
MPVTLGWHDVALRLALSLVAGSLIGLDRGEHGRQAGLRTTLLVCLAASVAMLLANFLLITAGRPSDSFATMDVMRLPLGILTGMGFIGGGAILRRDGLIVGVTTAATLWFVTVIGLCFGAGQMRLGTASLIVGLAVLTGLRPVESHMKQDHQAKLVVTMRDNDLTENEICGRASTAGYRAAVSSALYFEGSKSRKLEFTVKWRTSDQETDVPEFVARLSEDSRILSVEWQKILRSA